MFNLITTAAGMLTFLLLLPFARIATDKQGLAWQIATIFLLLLICWFIGRGEFMTYVELTMDQF